MFTAVVRDMLWTTYVSFLASVVYSVYACHLANDGWTRCTNLNELLQEKVTNRTLIDLIGRDKYVQLNRDSLKNVLNVTTLWASRILDDIHIGAFVDLRAFYWLKLTKNVIHRLRFGSFDNPTLEVITIANCDVWEIDVGVFKSNPKLKRVWIDGNKIASIKTGTFENENMNELALRGNNIQYIEDGAFIRCPKLGYLMLLNNRLKTISENLFVGVPNMDVLLLHINLIASIEEKAFSRFNKLRVLDVSNNLLKELPLQAFPTGDNQIDFLLIHNNLLTYFPEELLNTLGSLRTISMIGNPWQCQCYIPLLKHIQEKNISSVCDQDIRNGRRPACVFPEGFATCTYDKTYRDEVISYYQKSIRSYPQLAPICQTRDRKEPVLEPNNQ